MIGSWRWNAVFGGFGALLTFVFSLGNNPITITFIRCVYAFLAFALIAFAVRFLLASALPPSRPDSESVPMEDRGSVLDLVTPGEEEALSEMMKENWTGGKENPVLGFQPLQPKRLVSLDNPDPEEVVQAIRRLTDER
ncbi:hypothetical protein GE107_00530 [Cohnella sp. CFH 77786]|uniref:hypothetical protein n=1 Tax=Cohnella sp. CFH 77786 TaxID=2662265 RepID=UPI001C610689|nr:hypothetical protein [Cohnella sp. CFH 77786]MBW5444550.1 hypothetical protein [Cohnella sp. CFH 77786]